MFISFVEHINHTDLGLRFTFEINANRLPFLDVLVTKSSMGTLDTTIYQKPPATNFLLHWWSNHPMPLKEEILWGHCLCLRHICSTKTGFSKQANYLHTRFVEKGYSDYVLCRAFKKAVNMDRSLLLTPKLRKMESQSIQPMRIIGTFNYSVDLVKAILKKHWEILLMDSDLNKHIGPHPMLTFRRGQNLCDKLTLYTT